LDSIIARSMHVADFIDSIDPKRTFKISEIENEASRGVLHRRPVLRRVSPAPLGCSDG
jgi:hypothetical protein